MPNTSKVFTVLPQKFLQLELMKKKKQTLLSFYGRKLFQKWSERYQRVGKYSLAQKATLWLQSNYFKNSVLKDWYPQIKPGSEAEKHALSTYYIRYQDEIKPLFDAIDELDLSLKTIAPSLPELFQTKGAIQECIDNLKIISDKLTNDLSQATIKLAKTWFREHFHNALEKEIPEADGQHDLEENDPNKISWASIEENLLAGLRAVIERS